jgi:hypothetical protein
MDSEQILEKNISVLLFHFQKQILTQPKILYSFQNYMHTQFLMPKIKKRNTVDSNPPL